MVRVVYMGTLDCCRSSPTSMVQNWARVSTSLGRKVPSLSPDTAPISRSTSTLTAVLWSLMSEKEPPEAAAGRARERSAAAVSSAARIRFNFILISPVFL